MDQGVLLTELQYKRLIKKLEVYENKLNEINVIAENLSEFNPTYERIAFISTITKKNQNIK